jgi:ribulose-phosphate 3-epimerase
MKIVPSVLAENYEDFLLRIRQAESITDFVQIDLMDGVFVENKSFPPEKINGTNTSLSFEVHLMIQDPLRALKDINHPNVKRAIFHFESDVRPEDFISAAGERGIGTGLAVKPETGIDDFRDLAQAVDMILFLTVDPGQYGSPFRPEVAEKVAEARNIFPDKLISVDGGISLDNLKTFYDIGVDFACVGSRIFLKGEPEENYRRFTDKIREFERLL